jgi:hypothetical protein
MVLSNGFAVLLRATMALANSATQADPDSSNYLVIIYLPKGNHVAIL